MRTADATGREKRSCLLSPKLAVVIATRGRPGIVSRVVRHILEHQTIQPKVFIISCVATKDAGDCVDLAQVHIVVGAPGLPVQRNTALDALPSDIEVVVFFDDDFLPQPDWLEIAAKTFQQESEVVGFTGHLLADGIHGPGLSFEQALQHLASDRGDRSGGLLEPCSPYGCNMAFRMSAIGDSRFDERLVLYGWQEDRDFGATLSKKGGRLVKSMDARGVHLGIKAGRVRGDRLGYSQVINPVYMVGKGTMSVTQASSHILGNVGSNLIKAIRPEAYVDRRGRLRGNFAAFADLFRGYVRPERAAELRPVGTARRASAGSPESGQDRADRLNSENS